MSKIISLSELPAKTVSTDDIRCVTSTRPDEYDRVIVTFSLEETQKAFYHELIKLIYDVDPDFLLDNMEHADELRAACCIQDEHSITFTFEDIWNWFDTNNSIVMQVLAEWNKYLAIENNLSIMQNNMFLENTPNTIPFSTDTKVAYHTAEDDCYAVQCCDRNYMQAVADIMS